MAASDDPSWVGVDAPMPRRTPLLAPWGVTTAAIVTGATLSAMLLMLLALPPKSVQPIAPPSSPPLPTVQSKDGFANVVLTAVELTALCTVKLEAAAAIRDRLKGANPPTTKAEVLASVNTADVHGSIASLAGLMSSVSPNRTIRDAATTCELDFDSFWTAFYLNHKIYERIRLVASDAVADALAQRRYVRLLQAFERSGIGLENASQRERAQNISDAISRLSTDFEQVLASDTRTLRVAVSNTSALAGLSDKYVRARTTADGQYVEITTNYPDVGPVYKFAKSSCSDGARTIDLFSSRVRRTSTLRCPVPVLCADTRLNSCAGKMAAPFYVCPVAIARYASQLIDPQGSPQVAVGIRRECHPTGRQT